MTFLALATDYDGTAATDGRLAPATRAALERLRASGRKALLVTGRELGDLAGVMPLFELFDRIVAENGAVLHRPATGETVRLADPPPAAFVQRLRAAQIEPLSVGEVIVATTTPHETYVLEAIREFGLEHQIIFNKGSVMVLPPGVNKATGLAAALADLELSPRHVVAVGDAENDHALLAQCGCGVAVANALPMLKAEADWVTEGAEGAGVTELIERLLADDLRSVARSRA